MAGYELRIKPSAVKELERIARNTDRARIVSRIESLSGEPRPAGCVRLSGREEYRVRQGTWRILYTIDDSERVVVVVKVGHRRDVYE